MITVTLLGAAATMPLPDRALTSVYLSCGGHNVLFDCGEGTQTAIRKAHLSPMKIELICLSHYHGDHIFGLPGLLHSMSLLGRAEPLLITGPAGIETELAPIMALCRDLDYEVRLFPMPEEGLELAAHLHLKAFPTAHKMPSIGYRFELERPGAFLSEKAEALGIPKSCWARLQRGEAVDGFRPQDVLGEARKGLSVVFSGDTSPCPSLVENAAGADLFICEATYGDDAHLENAVRHGHSTFTQAAQMAAEAGVKRLWLAHFSQMVTEPEECLPLAEALFPGAEAGFDGKSCCLRFEEN